MSTEPVRADLWKCTNEWCHYVHPSPEGAASCCSPVTCDEPGCAEQLPRAATRQGRPCYWTTCQKHRQERATRRESERHAKAEPVPIAAYKHPLVYVIGSDGEEAFSDAYVDADLGSIADRLADSIFDPKEHQGMPEDEFDELVEEHAATLHIYAVTPASKRVDASEIVENLLDGYYDGAWDDVSDKSIDELQAFLDAWTEVNVPTSYEPDFKRKIVWLDAGVEATE